jgi:hypothetical protein
MSTQCQYTQLNKQTLKVLIQTLKVLDFNTVVVGEFNTPLSLVDRSSKQKINKEIQELNYTIY